MDELKALLIAKTGVDEPTAAKVITFLQENWDDVAKFIGGEKLEDLGETVSQAFEGAKKKIGGFLGKE